MPDLEITDDVQDLRSLVNDLARLAHEDGALRELLQNASRGIDEWRRR